MHEACSCYRSLGCDAVSMWENMQRFFSTWFNSAASTTSAYQSTLKYCDGFLPNFHLSLTNGHNGNQKCVRRSLTFKQQSRHTCLTSAATQEHWITQAGPMYHKELRVTCHSQLELYRQSFSRLEYSLMPLIKYLRYLKATRNS